jgi:hypothetical protein
MRPLNRPMFRYGGPIKEGIMNGMQDRPGYRFGSKVMSKIPFVGNLYNRGITNIGKIFDKIKPTFKQQPGIVTGGDPSTRAKYISQTMPKVPFMERAGAFVKENPYFTGAVGIGGTTSGLIPSTVGGLFDLGKRGVLQAADLLVDDRIFDQDKYFADKKLREQNEQNKLLQKKKKTLKNEKDKITTTTPKIDRDAEIQANRERYYKLMGIDKMKKDATYDSLIDASRIIQEQGGDLKGAIKSGNLQTEIINAISKNLDKSADIKKQIDAAILKGEIEKDINKEKNTLDKLVKEKQIKVLDKQLKGGDLNDTLSELRKQGIVPEGPELASYALRNDIDIPKGHVLNTKDINNFLKDNPTLTVVDYLNDQNLKLQQAGKGSLNPGNYVVGKNILKVGEDGTVTDVII